MQAMPLPLDQLRAALPLLRVTWPRVELAALRCFVESVEQRTASPRAGAIALRDPTDHVSGLLVYEAGVEWLEGAVLNVPLFTVVDLANSRQNVETLYDAACATARALGCGAIQIRLYTEQAGLAGRLRALGPFDRGDCLWARVTPQGIAANA